MPGTYTYEPKRARRSTRLQEAVDGVVRRQVWSARPKLIPRQKTAWFEGAGHRLHFEQAGSLARLIAEFLAKPTT